MDVTQEILREFCSYDAVTGKFMRVKVVTPRQARLVGRPCGGLNVATGYITLHVGGMPQYAHRLAWIYTHGEIPEGFYIDHINGETADNRLANLRLARHKDNIRNSKIRTDNTSGVKGVSWDRSRGQWAASVGKKHLGRFDTLLDAAAARKSAALAVYGDFAREG